MDPRTYNVFTASYPATILRKKDSAGFHVRFPDLPEALTGGDNLPDTLLQAADCLAEALAGRMARGDEIPERPCPNAANVRSVFRFISRRSWRFISQCASEAWLTRNWPDGSE